MPRLVSPKSLATLFAEIYAQDDVSKTMVVYEHEGSNAPVMTCERCGLEDLRHLAQADSSIAVPFFDIKRFFFVLESLAQHPRIRGKRRSARNVG